MPIPSAPMHYDHKTVLIGVEPIYGEPPVGPLNAVRLWDVQASWLEVEEKELPYVLPHMGNRPAVFLKKRMTLSAKVGLTGPGQAGAIPQQDALLRACGMVRTMVEATAAATIGPDPVAVGAVTGAWTYSRDAAYGGVFDRVVTVTVTKAGASGVAEVSIAAPAVEYLPVHAAHDVVVITGTAIALPGGAEITPTITDDLAVGDSWTIALTAAGCTYAPSSDRHGHKSAVLHILLPDPSAPSGQQRRYEMVGTRGQIKATGQVDDYPYFEVELTSLFTAPVMAVEVQADYSGWTDPVEISTDNTPVCRLFGRDLVVEQFGWDAGNDVSLVQRVGRQAVRINDRKSTASLKFEETGLADWDVLAAAAGRGLGGFVVQHGREPGAVVRLTAPSVQLGKPAQSESQKDLMVDVTLRLLPTSGDDEWSWFFG